VPARAADRGAVSLSWVTILFPVFVAGQMAGRRRFEPGWWVVPLAALLLAVMWTTDGANLTYATPAWAAGLPASWSPATGTLVRAVRLALQLSLIGTAFLAARGARRGAWLGGLTLAIYCAHLFFLPAWVQGGSVWGVAAGFAVSFSGGVGVALLVRRRETTSFLLFGSGVLPDRVRSRPPVRG
jgi:fucose 4-O-acetylase-like acetyltransferase